MKYKLEGKIEDFVLYLRGIIKNSNQKLCIR